MANNDVISRLDAIEAVSDYIFFDVYGGMKPVEKCKAEAKNYCPNCGADMRGGDAE